MINKKYTLFTRIPVLSSQNGKLFCEPLWAKDIKLHLNYILDFQLCCPIVNITDDTDIAGLEDITELKINKIFALNKDAGLLSVIKNFFPNFVTVIQACKNSEIVHSGGAGWAFPLSFYLLLLRPFLTFQWVIVIESSFWMLRKNEKVTFRKFIDHHLHSILLKQCIKNADARIFTQTFYKNYFLKNNERTLIAPATWVDNENMINVSALEQKVSLRKDKSLKFLFPARLEKNKGVHIVFDAIKILSSLITGPIDITIMGAGPLAGECKEFAKINHGHINVTFQEPVEYGQTFFELIFDYDVILVPNLAEEQPRIVYDAFSQGCVVIASNTSGIADVTENERNVLLFKRGDSQALAQRVNEVVKDRSLVLKLGLEALYSVKNKTHSQMHIDREKFLGSILKC